MKNFKYFKHFLLFKDLAICLIIFIAAAFPFGKMGNVATESVYNIIISSVNKTKAYEYLHCAFGCAAALLLFAFVHIPFFKNYKQHFKIVGTVISSIASMIFGILFFIISTYLSKIYGLTSVTFSAMIIIFTIMDVFLNFAGYFVYRKIKPSSEEAEEQTVIQSLSPVKRLFLSKNIEDFFMAVIITILAALSCFVGIPNNFNKYAAFKDTGYISVIQSELGDKFMGIAGVDDSFKNNFLDNFQEGSSHILNYKGTTYLYWQNKFVTQIEEKEKQIRELMPDSSSESDLKKYAEKIKILSEEVQALKTQYSEFNINFKYDNIKVTIVAVTERQKHGITRTANITEIACDTQFNGSSASGVKWNNKDNARLFYGQSIELTKTEFSQGTDFSSEQIGATIRYYDGSMKKAYVNPTNVSELNEASKGKHTLKWSDDWGSYEYTVNII